ncbi:MAG TPA: VC0807 family protein [Jatrophihabitans sp.]|nr:VC0807 family protein [Jatrophihabitans sp.]
MPSIGRCARTAGSHLIEGVVIPGVTFYAVLQTVSLRWALIASLLWAYLVIGIRLARRERVPGVLLLSAGLITARTGLALWANSTFVYFVQPSLANICVALLLLASLVPGKPLTRRLADDFCSLPASLDAHPRVGRFFMRLTVLWAFVCAVNGGASLLLLLHESLGSFLALRAVVSYGLLAVGIAVSTLWFRATLRGEGLQLVFGH